MCLPESYSAVHIDKNLPDKFAIQKDLQQGDTLLPLFFDFAFEYAIRRIRSTWKE
jgi:hypothetical protein